MTDRHHCLYRVYTCAGISRRTHIPDGSANELMFPLVQFVSDEPKVLRRIQAERVENRRSEALGFDAVRHEGSIPFTRCPAAD